MNLKNTEYGFTYGPAFVQRLASDDKKGWAYIGVHSKRLCERVDVYVTKTGKTRVYKNGNELVLATKDNNE